LIENGILLGVGIRVESEEHDSKENPSQRGEYI
jgi:hypothetical protein